MNSLVLSLLILGSILHSTHNLKILIYAPMISHSHVNFDGKIADILVRAGHNITFLSPQLGPLEYTNATKLAKVITVKPDIIVSEKVLKSQKIQNSWKMEDDAIGGFQLLSELSDLFYRSCEHLLNQDELTSQMRESKFDVIVTEYMTVCSSGLADFYKIPAMILTSAMTLNDVTYPLIGLNFPSSYVPGSFVSFTDKMSYTERLLNTMLYGFTNFYLNNILYKKYEELYQKKGGFSFEECKNKIGAIFINTLPWVDFPFPITTKVHFIGGSAIPVPKKLTKEWDDILSRRKTNILISFGTVAEAYKMPEDFKKGIINTMKNFPDITFIWKYEKELETLPLPLSENVILLKWIPQVDLLNDKRINIFITHGGMNSITEAVSLGKVTIAIPVFGDQMRNAKMVERLNVSITFQKKDLDNSDLLSGKIKYLLNNYEVYSKNAERQKNLMKDRPFKADETLIRITEFVGKHGPIPEMSLHSEDMNFFVFYNLDIYIPLLLVLISMVILSILCIRWVVMKIFFNNNVEKFKND